MRSAALTVSVLSFASSAYAWGALGHTTVALIAQNFLLPSTKRFAQEILNDTSASYLGNVANWPDSYRSAPGGAFTSVFHYIDALDNPPKQCNLDYERDCPEEGCIVSAIANYTQRVGVKSLDFEQRQQALKFIIHFLGDIHQPLHVENLAVGGNLINVTYAGVKTNLHRIWDTNIPEQFVGNSTNSAKWAKDLTHQLLWGKYALSKFTWLFGMNPRKPIDASMIWARGANKLVCTTVIPDGEAAVTNQELSTAYAKKAFPVVEEQIAKAGWRLAAWLNLIATGEDGCGNYSKQPLTERDVFVSSETKEQMKQRRDAAKAFRADIEARGLGCDCNKHVAYEH